MPGPAIYIAVAIGTAAAVIVFKELVYDPHLRPKVDAWRENLAARHRERRQRRRQAVPVRASSPSDDDHDAPPFRKRRTSLDSQHTSSPIELEKLVATEVEEWRSGVDLGGNQSGLRLRHPRGSAESTSQTLNSPSIMDEPGSPSVSHPPLEPARPGWGRDILFDYRGSHAVDKTQPPAPSASSTTLLDGLSTANAGTAVQQGAPLAPYARVADPASPPPAARGAYQPPAPPSIKIDATARRGNASPGLPTPTSLPPGGSPNPSISRISTPDTDLLTASVITSVDAFFTPQTVSLSPSALRTRTPSPAMSPALTASPSISIDVLSADSSRPGSPFSDVSASLSALGLHLNQSSMAGAQAQTNPFSSPEDPLSLPSSPSVLGGPDELLSPPSILGDLQSEMDFHSFAGDDDDLFSVPSSTGSDEDDFDDMSAVGSDASSWAGIGQHGSTRG